MKKVYFLEKAIMLVNFRKIADVDADSRGFYAELLAQSGKETTAFDIISLLVKASFSTGRWPIDINQHAAAMVADEDAIKEVKKMEAKLCCS